jgi:Tfp pilus assembly protein PilW
VSPRKAAPVEGEQGPDAGLSLIELIVAVVVSMMVVAGIASVFVNSWLAQSDVLSTSEASLSAQP